MQETPNKVFLGGNGGQALRHGWFLQRRLRPLCPHLPTSPTPSKWGDDTEHNAKLIMAYFRAWTLDKKRGNEVVPHIHTATSKCPAFVGGKPPEMAAALTMR